MTRELTKTVIDWLNDFGVEGCLLNASMQNQDEYFDKLRNEYLGIVRKLTSYLMTEAERHNLPVVWLNRKCQDDAQR